MSRKISLSQLKKYDVNQKVLEALADAQSRAILFSIIKDGKTAIELSEKCRIPLSSVYKKLSDLENLTLVRVENGRYQTVERNSKSTKVELAKQK